MRAGLVRVALSARWVVLVRLWLGAAFLVALGACSGSSSDSGPKSVDYYAKLTSQVRTLNSQNRQIIDGNLQQETPTAQDGGGQTTDEAVIRGSYGEFVANVDAFAVALEGIEPPPIAKTAHARLLAASRELVSVDRQIGDLFDAAHTPVDTDAALDGRNERAIAEWENACQALESLGVSDGALASHIPCSEAVLQDVAP